MWKEAVLSGRIAWQINSVAPLSMSIKSCAGMSRTSAGNLLDLLQLNTVTQVCFSLEPSYEIDVLRD
jgi:hypothetical protein